MNHEEISFEKLFTDRLKQKNISLKKITEMTGISRANLENIASGNFKDLPSAPYLHGYLVRLGGILDFDGEEWWQEIKKESTLKKSGPKDTLPKNRFIQKHPTKFIWAGALLLIAIIYLVSQSAKILGKPSIKLTFPTENPYATSSSELILRGTVTNADSLSVNGDTVPLLSGNVWKKNVLLQNGLNTFAIRAKKFLGGESNIVEQILYTETAAETSATSTKSVTSTVNSSETTTSIQ